MDDSRRPRTPRVRRYAGQVARNLDALCNDFQRHTARAYELRGPAHAALCADMRSFWNARDRLRVHIHAAEACPPERAERIRERLDDEWSRAQRTAQRARTHLESGHES